MFRDPAIDPGAGELRDGFAFYAGHAVLDLPATVRGRKRGATTELLSAPADLGRWLRAAGLCAAAPAVAAADLDAARRLRESVYLLALARIGGEAAPVGARRTLNRLAAGESARPQLTARGRLTWQGGASALLATLARDAVRLFAGEAAARIRQCEGEVCARLFIDTSRAGERRWCSMQSCGNKAKVAQFRRRQKQAAE